MTDASVLYTHPMSRGRIARWMLEEVGEPHEVRLQGHATEIKAPDDLATIPMGKVPAVLRYVERLDSRPAAVRAWAADDALLVQYPPRGS